MGPPHQLPITNFNMDENDLFARLGRAIATGQVSAELDLESLANMDSPICIEAEKNRWIYGIMAAVIGLGFAFGWPYGVAAGALGLALYLGFGRGRIRRRMTARFFDQTLERISDFKKLWRLSGVTLIHAADAAVCRSPDEDWRRFVLDHLAQHGDNGTA